MTESIVSRDQYADERQSSQFAATHRVEYEVDGRRNISFLANMSMSGMFMRSASTLQTGARLSFRVILDDGKDPLDIKGEVIEAHSAGTAPQGLNPLAVKVMHEVGIDISGRVSKYVDRFREVELDAGHWLIEEEPEQVVDIVMGHLRAQSR